MFSIVQGLKFQKSCRSTAGFKSPSHVAGGLSPAFNHVGPFQTRNSPCEISGGPNCSRTDFSSIALDFPYHDDFAQSLKILF